MIHISSSYFILLNKMYVFQDSGGVTSSEIFWQSHVMIHLLCLSAWKTWFKIISLDSKQVLSFKFQLLFILPVKRREDIRIFVIWTWKWCCWWWWWWWWWCFSFMLDELRVNMNMNMNMKRWGSVTSPEIVTRICFVRASVTHSVSASLESAAW